MALENLSLLNRPDKATYILLCYSKLYKGNYVFWLSFDQSKTFESIDLLMVRHNFCISIRFKMSQLILSYLHNRSLEVNICIYLRVTNGSVWPHSISYGIVNELVHNSHCSRQISGRISYYNPGILTWNIFLVCK